MGTDTAIYIARHLLLEALVLSAPILAAACLISFALSLLQTLTGIQEQTLTAVPRLVIVAAVGVLTLPWTVHRLVRFTTELWSDFGRYLG